LIDKGRAEVDVAAGVHDVLVALGSNCGKAWGIYLRLDRVDDGFTLPRVFTGA
jgi:hypothetical protein